MPVVIIFVVAAAVIGWLGYYLFPSTSLPPIPLPSPKPEPIEFIGRFFIEHIPADPQPYAVYRLDPVSHSGVRRVFYCHTKGDAIRLITALSVVGPA